MGCEGSKGATPTRVSPTRPAPNGHNFKEVVTNPPRASPSAAAGPQSNGIPIIMKDVRSFWTGEAADKLQAAVDEIFHSDGEFLFGLDFSFSIADPFLDGCPLIGCSQGFSLLTGYELRDIVGRNCRFLVDPVPPDQTDLKIRRLTKNFCEAVTQGKRYRIPESEMEPWMAKDRPPDELVAFQRNAKKDGTLFWNLFYMKVFELSPEFGEERPFIVGLQSDLPNGRDDLAELSANLEMLDGRMERLKAELSRRFFMRSDLSRQEHFVSSAPGAVPPAPGPLRTICTPGNRAPVDLAGAFPLNEVKPWDPYDHTEVRKLADASRNKGVVMLMQQKDGTQVAVKQMPNSWMQKCHKDFVKCYPKETEQPWFDIGVTRFLNDVNFLYACDLLGVYRDDANTYVVTSFATQGDMFSVAEEGKEPGSAREQALSLLAIKMFSAIRALHDMNIVHRDLSLENVLVTLQGGELGIKLIDFGMATAEGRFQRKARGKPSYQAPEMSGDEEEHDGFLSDAFAAGVIAFTMFTKEYPWQSTDEGACKCFEYVRKNGLRKCCEVRRVRGGSARIAEVVSGPLLDLLVGLLEMDPKQRLTLGEEAADPNAQSVFDTPWVRSQGVTLYTGYR